MLEIRNFVPVISKFIPKFNYMTANRSWKIRHFDGVVFIPANARERQDFCVLHLDT